MAPKVGDKYTSASGDMTVTVVAVTQNDVSVESKQYKDQQVYTWPIQAFQNMACRTIFYGATFKPAD